MEHISAFLLFFNAAYSQLAARALQRRRVFVERKTVVFILRKRRNHAVCLDNQVRSNRLAIFQISLADIRRVTDDFVHIIAIVFGLFGQRN